MKKELLFKYLKEQKASVLLELLEKVYDHMDTNQRRYVFGNIAKEIPREKIAGQNLLEEIQQFHRDSLAGVYYAPFEINSKNFTHVPEETEEWFERLGDLLKDSVNLTGQGKYSIACKCFGLLYELIFAMESGQEIVFAEELGGWMIPGDEKEYLTSYLKSLGAMNLSPEEFTEVVLPLVRRDSYSSFIHKVYTAARRVATDEQKKYLQMEAKKQKIRTR